MSHFQTYRVRPGYEVRLGPGQVFQADPADVAGALREGAIEPVTDQAPATSATPPKKPGKKEAE